MRKLFVATVVGMGLLADAALAEAPEIALVGDASEVQGCKRLGEVASSSLLGGLMASQGRTRAIASLKEKAKALGGTHIHLLSSNSGYAGSNMLGVAYRCVRPPAVATPSQETAPSR